jgi:hypothetical protein
VNPLDAADNIGELAKVEVLQQLLTGHMAQEHLHRNQVHQNEALVANIAIGAIFECKSQRLLGHREILNEMRGEKNIFKAYGIILKIKL